MFRTMLLNPPAEEELADLDYRESIADFSHLVGQQGTATTNLMPAGKADFDGAAGRRDRRRDADRPRRGRGRGEGARRTAWWCGRWRRDFTTSAIAVHGRLRGVSLKRQANSAPKAIKTTVVAAGSGTSAPPLAGGLPKFLRQIV